MKILYNRYKDKNNNLFVVIGKYMSLDEKNLENSQEAINQEPSFVKVLEVNQEATHMVPYDYFKKQVQNNTLTQIIN